MGFQDIRPNTGAVGGGAHVVQVVRRQAGDLNNNKQEDDTSLSIRNESGGSFEDIVSVMTAEEVCVRFVKYCDISLSRLPP